MGKVVIKKNTNMEENPYAAQKRSIQLQLAQVEQKEVEIARAKVNYPSGNPQRISLEQQEGSLAQRRANLEEQMAAVEQKEANWYRTQQK